MAFDKDFIISIIETFTKKQSTYTTSYKGKKKFSDIISNSESRSDMVAAFLAILELAKTKHVMLTGDGQNVEIELIKVPEGELDFD